MTILLRITQAQACFGLVIIGGRIVRAAPIAGWTLGKQGRAVATYYQRRGAVVEVHPVAEREEKAHV